MAIIILIGKKGSNKPIGFTKAKAGTNKTKLRFLIRKNLKKGLTFKIISIPESKIKNMILRFSKNNNKRHSKNKKRTRFKRVFKRSRK